MGSPVYTPITAPAPAGDEAAIVELIAAGSFEQATTVAFRLYGEEVLRFLATCHRDVDDAAEVFARAAEIAWRNLRSFEQRSTIRAYLYGVARRVSLNYRREQRRLEERYAPLPETSSLFGVIAAVRTATLPCLRTARRERFAALRDALPEGDREMLILRVDRGLSWLDLAQVLRGEEAEPLVGDDLKREAARLRKRFQIVKRRLRELGQREGLFASSED